MGQDGRQKTFGRIPTLDGWRGIAILLVMCDHLQNGAFQSHALGNIGLHGVAIFFVLSGFLITTRLMEEDRISLKKFYVRRFFRLMPAAWLYLLAITFIIGPEYRARPGHWMSVAACVLFFRNFVEFKNVFWITSHFWSLSIEEQFYLIWPLLLVTLKRRAVWFAAIAACVLAFGSWFRLWAYTSLLVGCFFGLFLPRLKPYLRQWMIWLVLGLPLCFQHFATPPFLESIGIGLLFSLTSTFSYSHLSRFLDWQPIAYIGTISYSLYLWQQFFLFYPAYRGTVSIIWRVGLSFAFAAASYYWIEKPSRRKGQQLTSTKRLELGSQCAAWPRAETETV